MNAIIETTTATAWGYGRQSHDNAIVAGEGLPSQGERTRAYWECFLKPQGVPRFFFIPDDSAVSARTSPFLLRVAGKSLMSLMQPGDHFIIDKIDRLWRSNEDFVKTMAQFKARGVTLHICNLMGASIQLGTPMGDFFMNVMVSIAQLESDQVSDRTRAAKRQRRARGLYASCRAVIPLGCRVIGEYKRTPGGPVQKNTLQLIWDDKYRQFMGEIVRLADQERLTTSQIRKMARPHFMQMLGRDYWLKEIYGKKSISDRFISNNYWRERQYRVLPEFNPNRIKFEIFKPTVDDYYRDIGPAEPNTPNPYPFLDGRPIPATAEELYKIGG